MITNIQPLNSQVSIAGIGNVAKTKASMWRGDLGVRQGEMMCAVD